MRIEPITDASRSETNRLLKQEWDCPPCISRGRAIDTTHSPGFVCMEGNEISGLVTYRIEEGSCEILTLNSFAEDQGVGSTLVKAVMETAAKAGCHRLWLVTTNDDIRAIRFYQKRGFDLVAAHINAMEEARRMKPSIPKLGMEGIPLRHELEFEILL